MSPRDLKQISLSTLVAASFVALVLTTAVAAGLPAVRLVSGQMERIAWSQVDHGARATQALYAATRRRTEEFAALTARRPTLVRLLQQKRETELAAYLASLHGPSGLDSIVVCEAADGFTVAAGTLLPVSPCAGSHSEGYYVTDVPSRPQAWYLATHEIADDTDSRIGSVTVGAALSDEFAETMKSHTGLEHTVFIDEGAAASSLDTPLGDRSPFDEIAEPMEGLEGAQHGAFMANGRPFFCAQLALATADEIGADLRGEVALDVSDIFATRRGLISSLAAAVAAIALLGSLAGVYLARRISRPLERLARAAQAMSRGDFATRVDSDARVREIRQVARALDEAQVELERSLLELRRERAWTTQLLDAMIEGIVTLDEHGRITFFGKGAERITGWSRDEVMGRPVDEVLRLADSDEPFSQAVQAQPLRKRASVVLRNGHTADLSMTAAEFRLQDRHSRGEASETAVVFRDVSAEEALHQLLGKFLANVTHEFRTPLSALAASAELLMDQASDLSHAELGQLLSSLFVGIVRLQNLVDNLLESASIETGRFRVQPRPTDIAQVVAEAAHIMQPILEKHDQTLVVTLPTDIPRVRADARRSVQVLTNLLSNAGKFGPDGSEIELAVAHVDSDVRISVADRGPGVPPQYQQSVFRRFLYEQEDLDTSKIGAGLGLSVVKTVVEAHGGQVGVTSREGGGSVFWFTLPKDEGN